MGEPFACFIWTAGDSFGMQDPEGIRTVVAGMGLNLTAFVATHYHFDHIGNLKHTHFCPLILALAPAFRRIES